MSNEKPAEQPKTVELPRVDIAGMLHSLSADVKSVLVTADKTAQDVDMLLADRKQTNIRLTRIEERVDDFDARLTRNSTGVHRVSQSDSQQNDKLAATALRQAELELVIKETKALAQSGVDRAVAIEKKTDAQSLVLTKQTELLNTLVGGASKFFAHPTVKVIATMLGAVIIGWLASHGGKP